MGLLARPAQGSVWTAVSKPDSGTHEEEAMKVNEVMTQDVRLIEPTQTIRDAARLMAELDAGIMPVREGDRSGWHDHRPRHCHSGRGPGKGAGHIHPRGDDGRGHVLLRGRRH